MTNPPQTSFITTLLFAFILIASLSGGLLMILQGQAVIFAPVAALTFSIVAVTGSVLLSYARATREPHATALSRTGGWLLLRSTELAAGVGLLVPAVVLGSFVERTTAGIVSGDLPGTLSNLTNLLSNPLITLLYVIVVGAAIGGLSVTGRALWAVFEQYDAIRMNVRLASFDATPQDALPEQLERPHPDTSEAHAARSQSE